MPRPLFEREAAEEERQPTAERVETERRDAVVVEVPRWLLIVAEHAPPKALAAVVKSAALGYTPCATSVLRQSGRSATKWCLS